MPNLEGTLINNRYRLIRRKCVGGYGDIYTALNEKRERVIIKIEQRTDNQSLSNEIAVYRAVRRVAGYPKMYDSGVYDGRQFLVLSHLGEDLEKMRTDQRGRLSSATVAMIMIQLMHRVEWLHHFGFVHGDIKPRNVLVGNQGGRNQRTLYLIDFGSAGKFRERSGHHVADGRATGRPAGTPMFAPIRWHMGRQQSRRDDLLTLVYSMVFLYKGQLPWRGDESERQILRKKREISASELCSSMPSQMLDFYIRIRRLEFNERPDYTRLRSLMRSVLSAQRIRDEQSFQWL